MHRDHLRGALRRGSRCDRPSACGRDAAVGVAARPATRPSARACPTSLLAPPRSTASRGRSLGGRPDHRQGQPLLDAVAHRAGDSLLDRGHDARGLCRRGDARRARRRPRSHPAPPPALDHLRPGQRVGMLGDRRLHLRHGRLVLRPAQPVAAGSGREPEPPVALLVPLGYRPRVGRPSPCRSRRFDVNGQRRRSLGYQSLSSTGFTATGPVGSPTSTGSSTRSARTSSGSLHAGTATGADCAGSPIVMADSGR